MSIRPGQKVDLAVDSFGGRVVPGVVTSIAPASGAQFSLLPPDNATGNFTKVVQRVAVRIAVAPEVLAEGRLRPGLSVVASIHTRDESLPKPTLLGALGFGDKASRRGRQAMSATTVAAAPAVERFDKRRLAAFIFMVFGMFMAILDIQIVSASLSQIQAGLSASQDEITWVQTAYLIAEVIMIPLSGFLSRAFSTRIIFFVSAAGFTLMSFMCSRATSIDEMIVWRALQGFIGGGMIPTVFASAYTIFPRSKQPIVAPIIGLVATLAPTIGPTVGGYLTDRLLLALAVPGQHRARHRRLDRRLDADRFRRAGPEAAQELRLGRPASAMAAFLGALEYALEEGPSKDWFEDASR